VWTQIFFLNWSYYISIPFHSCVPESTTFFFFDFFFLIFSIFFFFRFLFSFFFFFPRASKKPFFFFVLFCFFLNFFFPFFCLAMAPPAASAAMPVAPRSLLEPLRALADNWDIDIARDLEQYARELSRVTFTLAPGGARLNFSEAALVIQGSACVYGRKVEYLHALVFNALDLVTRGERSAVVAGEGDDDGGDDGENGGKRRRGRRGQHAELHFEELPFLPLDDDGEGAAGGAVREADGIDLVEDADGDAMMDAGGDYEQEFVARSEKQQQQHEREQLYRMPGSSRDEFVAMHAHDIEIEAGRRAAAPHTMAHAQQHMLAGADAAMFGDGYGLASGFVHKSGALILGNSAAALQATAGDDFYGGADLGDGGFDAAMGAGDMGMDSHANNNNDDDDDDDEHGFDNFDMPDTHNNGDGGGDDHHHYGGAAGPATPLGKGMPTAAGFRDALDAVAGGGSGSKDDFDPWAELDPQDRGTVKPRPYRRGNTTAVLRSGLGNSLFGLGAAFGAAEALHGPSHVDPSLGVASFRTTHFADLGYAARAENRRRAALRSSEGARPARGSALGRGAHEGGTLGPALAGADTFGAGFGAAGASAGGDFGDMMGGLGGLDDDFGGGFGDDDGGEGEGEGGAGAPDTGVADALAQALGGTYGSAESMQMHVAGTRGANRKDA
jgi:hypothetical protein